MDLGGNTDDARQPSIDEPADQMQLLVHVCRLIARRADNADLSGELIDLAASLDTEIAKLRIATARTINQIADQLQLLIQRCRMISLRANTIHMAAELMDLATLLDYEVERLRVEVA